MKKQKSLFKKNISKPKEGYYSKDLPNENLQSFILECLEKNPYNPEKDSYDTHAFNKSIETAKTTPLYNMHAYWSKKPYGAIRKYIEHYTSVGDIVLDPFSGSGGTPLVALQCERKAVAIDRSPAATFLTKNYCTPINADYLTNSFDELSKTLHKEIEWLYETRCDLCDGKALTTYTVYSQVYQCQRCMSHIAIFDCINEMVAPGSSGGGKSGKQNLCPKCFDQGLKEVINPKGQDKLGIIPVLVNFKCIDGCKKRSERSHNDVNPNKREFFKKYDLKKIREIENKEIPYWYPLNKFPIGDRYFRDGLKYNQIEHASDFFTKRNLWALSAIRDSIDDYSHLMLAFNSIILNSSKLYRHRKGGGGGSTGNYYIPQIFREMNVWPQIEKKIKNYVKLSYGAQFKSNLIISTQSATNIGSIPANSIDYIFTDPPYAGKVQFGELNFVWESWLKFDTDWLSDEIIVNAPRGKSVQTWHKLMKESMEECHRVLKPGRWLSLCYHDTSEGTWSLVQDIMAEVGFIADKSEKALFIDTQQKSYNQLTADKVNKRDLVINFQKPSPKQLNMSSFLVGDEKKKNFRDSILKIIRRYLELKPGSTKDRIYDEVVSHMVRSGQMETHDFESFLREVAEEIKQPRLKDISTAKKFKLLGTHEISRWYLKENEFDIQDSAESAKENSAAKILAAYMLDHFQKNPEFTGVHYSDLFEQFVYTVHDKPRRHLADWLLDYFFKTEEGTYRLPNSDEEKQLKVEGRKKGTNRRVKRFLSFIEQGVGIPKIERPNDATIAEWIRHCKRSGMYEQGKLLYEKGGLNIDSLPEVEMVNIEEDYQVCARLLDRGSEEKSDKKQGKGRKKKR